jgi:hypothetical protein
VCRDAIAVRRADDQLFAEIRQAFQEGDGTGGGAESSPGVAMCDAMPPAERLAIEGYRIVDELHRGGQGVVYKAIQRATKRTVALKLLLQGAYASLRQRQRFEREVDAVASLQHPNIVTIYESGVCDGRPFYAMEFVHGNLMLQWLRDADNDFPVFLQDATPLGADILFATWNGSNFSTPATAVIGARTNEAPRFDRFGDQALVAWSEDADGDQGTTTDTSIRAAIWDGTSWSAPTALAGTLDSLADDSPRVAYDSSGGANVVWVKHSVPQSATMNDVADQLFFTEVAGGVFSAPVAAFESRAITAPSLIEDGGDNLIASWQRCAGNNSGEPAGGSPAERGDVFSGVLAHPAVSNAPRTVGCRTMEPDDFNQFVGAVPGASGEFAYPADQPRRRQFGSPDWRRRCGPASRYDHRSDVHRLARRRGQPIARRRRDCVTVRRQRIGSRAARPARARGGRTEQLRSCGTDRPPRVPARRAGGHNDQRPPRRGHIRRRAQEDRFVACRGRRLHSIRLGGEPDVAAPSATRHRAGR